MHWWTVNCTDPRNKKNSLYSVRVCITKRTSNRDLYLVCSCDFSQNIFNKLCQKCITIFLCNCVYNNITRGREKKKRGSDDGLAGVGICMDERKEGRSIRAMRWHIEMLSLCQSETPVPLPFVHINHFYLYNQPTLLSSQSFGQDRQTDRSIIRIISHYFIHTLFQRSHYQRLWVFWTLTASVQ